uniref:Uncharacterized protein LOC100187247 n=1 Tax=Phallusia mammillata TaxID=59560 RepID=A0A6F9DJ58_9ASCI|nr:uncharacterized protein LOC100187247 [Phallusia mammillata]
MASGDSLTKEQLKEQLIANGIQLPSAKAPKAVYVDLYNSNIINNHGQFSSDDDTHVDSSRGRKQKISQRTAKHEESEDLTRLTNSEIASRLKKLGVKPGPIGQTTRNVYLKKLSKLLSGNDQQTKHEENYSDEENEEKPAAPTVSMTRSSSRRRTMLLSDNPPQVSTRRSLSLSNRTPALSAPLAKSSSSTINKRRSVATFQETNISSTQPSLCQSTPNLSFLTPNWKSSQKATLHVTCPSSTNTLSKPVSVAQTTACELTPSWVNVSLSEVVDKSLNQNSDGTAFSLDKFSDNEEPFDILDDETLADGSYNNTVINKAEISRSTTLLHNSSISNNMTPIENKSKKIIPRKSEAQNKNGELSSPNFAHARTSTRYETFKSPNHATSSYLKRAHAVCGSATRRRPLRSGTRSSTGLTKTPEKIEKPSVETDGTPKPAAQETEEQTSSERRWLPVWVQVIITLILVVFFYLVLQYLETNPPPPALPKKN